MHMECILLAIFKIKLHYRIVNIKITILITRYEPWNMPRKALKSINMLVNTQLLCTYELHIYIQQYRTLQNNYKYLLLSNKCNK